MKFSFCSRPEYHLTNDGSDVDSEGDAPSFSPALGGAPASWRGRCAIPVLPAVALTIAISTCAALIGVWCGRHLMLDDLCTRHTVGSSPILDRVDVRYHEVQFDGRFVQENEYRGQPEAGVRGPDEAWEALGIGYKPVLISDNEAVRAGLTKNHSRRNSKYGGGYPVFIEGLHQLHCLNLVRQSLYYNYDYYLARGADAFGDPPEVLHWHVSHCLDILRQRLACSLDVGVFGSVWVNRTDPHPFVDFNTKHVCRNFDEIRAWAEKNQIEYPLPSDYWEPIGDDVYVWEKAP